MGGEENRAVSENPPKVPATPPPEYPAEYTEEDARAMFQTVVWLDDLRSAGELPQYRGMHVAAVEKRILDADPDPDVLDRRLAALADPVPLHRIVYRYFPAPDDPYY
jgi:hypothetical protein